MERQQNIPLGIGLMLFGVLLFSVNDLLGKWLAASYTAPQILLLRSVIPFVILLVMLRGSGWRDFFNVSRPWVHVLRATLAAVEVMLFYWSVHYLPLADAMTYYLAGPIYVTVMAALVLKEPVGWRRWTAVIVGFIGVIVALGPQAVVHGWPVLIALAGSIAYAVFLVTTRMVRGTPDRVLAMWQVVASIIGAGILAPVMWAPVTSVADWGMLFGLGIAALIGMVCVNRSLAIAPASAVVPYQYTIIVWAVVFGYLAFGDVPTLQVLLGAVIIVGAGVFIFLREARVGVAQQKELAPER